MLIQTYRGVDIHFDVETCYFSYDTYSGLTIQNYSLIELREGINVAKDNKQESIKELFEEVTEGRIKTLKSREVILIVPNTTVMIGVLHRNKVGSRYLFTLESGIESIEFDTGFFCLVADLL